MHQAGRTPNAAVAPATTPIHISAVKESTSHPDWAANRQAAVEQKAIIGTRKCVALVTKWSDDMHQEGTMPGVVEALPTTTTPTCAAMANTLLRRLEMTSMPHAVERPATTSTRKSAALGIKW